MNAKMIVHHASLLNAEGVHALTAGNAPFAHHKFKQALETLSLAANMSLPDVPSQSNVVSCCPVPGFEQIDYYVCNNAFLFNVSHDQEVDSSTVALCCQASMFNLALMLHQRGTMTGSLKNLAMASRLYEQCLLISSDLEGQDTSVFAMATLNNVAQIYYSLGDFDTAVERLNSVKKLIRQSAQNEYASSVANALQLDDVMLNVLVTCKPSTAPCA